jgi:Tol biopolymer transport system component
MAHPLSRQDVLAQLDRILASRTFAGATRSCALLTFVVQHATNGHADQLKEYTLGADALGRGPSFDPRIDPIVRAEVSRLRTRLERYYASEGARDRVVVTLPKGSYVPRFYERVVPEPAPAPVAGRPGIHSDGRRTLVWLAAASVFAGGLALAVLWRGRDHMPAPRVVSLAALPSQAQWPTFSPDGNSVAFTWDGEKGDNRDIYVKLVGAPELRRLTTNPDQDMVPAWSPDGLSVAFVRSARRPREVGAIYVVSPLSGPERRVSDWPAVGYGALSWSPDSRFLLAARDGPGDTPEDRSIYLIPLDGRAPRRLTRAAPGGRDIAPALSPDGRRLAYARCRARPGTACAPAILDLASDFTPIGAPRVLVRQALHALTRIVWVPDGRAVVYDNTPLYGSLWRVAVDGRSQPERIELAGVGAWSPAISGSRLAFTRSLQDEDVVRYSSARAREPFVASSFWDGDASISADGGRVAFLSMRSGDRPAIWLADADGSDPVQRARGPGMMQGSPAWSPDGQRIAFDSMGEDGRWDIWVMDRDNGAPRRLTTHAEDEHVPNWSRDGRAIYYFARRDGGHGIWRLDIASGREERVVATDPSSEAFAQESPDGRTLLWAQGFLTPLRARPLDGSAERTLASCIREFRGFAVTDDAVFYAACPDEQVRFPDATLRRIDLASGRDEAIGTLEQYRTKLAVSPDGRTVVYTSLTRRGSDLMLIEGFR